MEQTIGFLERFPYLTALITFIIGLLTMPFVLNFAKSRNMVVRPNKRTTNVFRLRFRSFPLGVYLV